MLPLLVSAVLLSNVLAPSTVRDASDAAAQRRQGRLEEVRMRRQEAVENAQTQREEFQEKVNQIRSEAKQRVLSNLAERFTSVNEKWVNHWTRVLSRFSEILDKMAARIEHIGEQTGKDITAAMTAIGEAEAAIATAQEAVAAQAGKTYVPEIDDEATVGVNVRDLVSQFKADLKETLGHVQVARRAMTDALSSMKTLAGSGSEREVEDEE
jgi:membrane-associated HD superfamily phosphohydrolase